MIEWTDRCRVGNTEIDTSAQRVFELTNQVLTTTEVAALRHLLQELYRHTRDHFALEERLMVEHAYPDAAEHGHVHRRALERLDILCMDVGKGFLNKRGIESLMRDWAEKHVPEADAAFGRFLAQRPVQTPEG